MVFSSLSFIYLFLPLTALCYFVCKKQTLKNAVLLLASLVFYSWGEPKFLLLILFVSAAAFVGGLLIDKYEAKAKKRKVIFVITLILIILNLFVFKYFNFAADNISKLLGCSLSVKQIALPTGISFYTFQVLSYVIDLYRGKVEVQKNYFYLLLYVCFFPQLIAGPIVRYSDVQFEIENRRNDSSEIEYGIKRFIIGLSKKVLIANQVSKFAKTVYESPQGSFDSLFFWLAAIAYTLEIYFDFSAYSDMAIGLGRIFGFHFLENFDHPYISCSITEFWRRWHISLSSWFKDYVYIPLGGNRVPLPRYIFNIFAVWALTGLWHGASWNFVLWGLYYAVLLCIEKFVLKKIQIRLPKIISWLATFFFVTIGWVIFNLTDPSQCLFALKMMFSPSKLPMLDMLSQNTELIVLAAFIPLGIIFMFPMNKLGKIKNAVFKNSKPGSKAAASFNTVSDIVYLILLAVCTVFLLATSYNPFIYFRF